MCVSCWNMCEFRFDMCVFGKDMCEFRCDIITSFASSASRLVKEYDLTFSCTCFSGDEDRKKYVDKIAATLILQGYLDKCAMEKEKNL